MCILCICVRVLWAPRHVQDRGASGFPHADQLLAATYKACMFWKNVPHTHANHPAQELAWVWGKKSEYFWSTPMCVRVCERQSVGCIVVFCREITSYCSCAEPTRDSTYSHTDTHPAWNTHTALFSIRGWLERKASTAHLWSRGTSQVINQLVKKKAAAESLLHIFLSVWQPFRWEEVIIFVNFYCWWIR